LVKDKDVLVLASDGVFDNIYDPDLLTCLSQSRGGGRRTLDAMSDEEVNHIASCIAGKAERLG
jgi:serine/threonine protein phosphatase PrpC